MKKRGQKFSSIKPWKVLNKELILFRIDFALLYLNQNFQYNLVKFLQKDNSKINICQRKYENLLSEVLRLNHFQRSVPEGEGDSLYKSSISNYDSTLKNHDNTLINHNSTLINYEIADLKAQVSVKLAEARLLRIEIKGFADMVENLARGLHSENPEKLVEYDIKLRKPPEPTSKPSMVLTLVMKDGTDGVGFLLSLQEPDDNAEHYDWKKGIGADPKDDLTVPAMSFLISTTKSQYPTMMFPKVNAYFIQFVL